MRTVMKMSRLFGMTLREAPAGARSASRELLIRAGFIRQADHGGYACLPPAMRSIARIESLARGAMERMGGQAVSLPAAAGETMEEAGALLCTTEARSWRQLPRLLFQMRTSSALDERLRSGHGTPWHFSGPLSTGTGSIVSVSIDMDEEGRDRQFRAHAEAFRDFFSECGLPVETVESWAGVEPHSESIVSPCAAGPDVIVRCPSCGYGAEHETARFLRPADRRQERPMPVEKVATPGCPTIADLAAFLGIEKSRTAKAVLLMAATGRQRSERFVFAVVRGDRELSERKLAAALTAHRLRPADEHEIRAAGAVPGYASPVGLPPSTFVIVDEEVPGSSNLVSGANEQGFHLLHTNIPRDYRPAMIGDIARTSEGDRCHRCGALFAFRAGVTVGGLRKAAPRPDGAGAVFQDRDGKERPILFGSYDVALDRLLALIAEEHHDDRGLVWPAAVAPFEVHLISLGAAGSPSCNEAERLYHELEGAGRRVLFDDRDERPGVKFADADLIGEPVRLTVSDRSLQAGGVEIKLRRREGKEMIPSAMVAARVLEDLRY